MRHIKYLNEEFAEDKDFINEIKSIFSDFEDEVEGSEVLVEPISNVIISGGSLAGAVKREPGNTYWCGARIEILMSTKDPYKRGDSACRFSYFKGPTIGDITSGIESFDISLEGKIKKIEEESNQLNIVNSYINRLKSSKNTVLVNIDYKSRKSNLIIVNVIDLDSETTL